MTTRPTPGSVDAHIVSFPPDVRAILQRLRSTVWEAAPDAEEAIGYKMPASRLDGVLLYFAAFAKHVGPYSPVAGDPALERALARDAGLKGSLRFPLDEPMPYELVARIARLRVRQDRARAKAGSAKGR